MAFWTLAYNMKWVTKDQLRLAVKTSKNPFGEITPKQYETITGVTYEAA